MRYSCVLLTIQRNLMCFSGQSYDLLSVSVSQKLCIASQGYVKFPLWMVFCMALMLVIPDEICNLSGFYNELCLEYHRLIESGDGQQCSSAFIKIIYPTLLLPDTYLNQKTMKHLIYSVLIVILLVILCMVIIFADANFCKFQFACKGMFLGNY